MGRRVAEVLCGNTVVRNVVGIKVLRHCHFIFSLWQYYYNYVYRLPINPIICLYNKTNRCTHFYGCETWAMTITEQNHLLVFERRILRKIYGPTLDNDGT